VDKYINKKYYIAGCVVLTISYLIFRYFFFKVKIAFKTKKIMKSIPNKLLHLNVNIKFYMDKVEFNSSERTGILRYGDFYKIMKVDDGYIFLTTKNTFHYFEYQEIKTLYNLDYLDSILEKFYK